MKTFKDLMNDILTEDETFFNVGDSVKFVQGDVAPYNVGKNIGFDYGVILKLSGKDYIVKMDDGVEITVQNQHAYAFGNADGAAI